MALKRIGKPNNVLVNPVCSLYKYKNKYQELYTNIVVNSMHASQSLAITICKYIYVKVNYKWKVYHISCTKHIERRHVKTFSVKKKITTSCLTINQYCHVSHILSRFKLKVKLNIFCRSLVNNCWLCNISLSYISV